MVLLTINFLFITPYYFNVIFLKLFGNVNKSLQICSKKKRKNDI